MIAVNGDRIEFHPDETIASLIERLGFVFPLLVVRVNGKLIERKHYDRVFIEDEDAIDVFHLMSGG